MKKFKESVFWKSPAKVSIILFVILEIITFYLQPNLFSMSWISLKAESAITLLFAAVGETFVLLVGGIDLSIAGVISITSSVAAVYMQDSWISVILISVLCLCIGAGVGFFNGFIIQKFRIQPFIVTFATWYICGGKKVNYFAYAASGIFAAMCGLYRVAVTATGSPTAGESFFNQAISATVIGGTLLTGGIGGQYGTIIGVLAFKAINDLLVFAGASSYWSTLFQGALLIAAVLISTISEIRNERKELVE